MFMRLTDKGEMGVLVPHILSQVDKERIGVFGGLWRPVSIFPLGVDNLSLKDLFVSVNKSSVLYPAQLLLVNLVDLRTHMPIVQMDAVDLIFLYQFN